MRFIKLTQKMYKPSPTEAEYRLQLFFTKLLSKEHNCSSPIFNTSNLRHDTRASMTFWLIALI